MLKSTSCSICSQDKIGFVMNNKLVCMRCDELLFMRTGRVIARGTGTELRRRAGTDDLEGAFVRFANDAGGAGVASAIGGSVR